MERNYRCGRDIAPVSRRDDGPFIDWVVVVCLMWLVSSLVVVTR